MEGRISASIDKFENSGRDARKEENLEVLLRLIHLEKASPASTRATQLDINTFQDS